MRYYACLCVVSAPGSCTEEAMLRRQTLLSLVSLLFGCSLSAAATGEPADEPPDTPQAEPARPPRAVGDAAPAQGGAPADAEDEEPAEPTPEQPGAPSSMMMDASMQPALDASLRADASRDGSARNGAVPRSVCEGASALGSCWYLGARGLSCEQACSERGGFDPASIALVGTRAQGGTLENCATVMSALGVRGMVMAAVRLDDVGIGCHRWATLDYWLAADTVLYTGSSSAPLAELACACNH
jgi:hypothetical protein